MMISGELERKKWRKFLRRVWLFRFVPFVDFVLVAGSMATGEIHEKSDFDVIVGARQGRIFTARFFAVVFFQLFGWRRSKLNEKEAASDKICMNHFVTPRSYRLSPLHNTYWNHLYQNLIPILGNEESISNFFKANDWMKALRIYPTSSSGLRGASKRDPRYLGHLRSLPKRFLESVLHGSFGARVERILREDQIKRIESGLPQTLGYKPRFIYNDDELEFHPDTSRIEKILKELTP